MQKALNGLSVALSVIMIGITAMVGWYQAVQVIDLMTSVIKYGYHPTDRWCKVDMSNLCTIWPDRFTSIAFGVAVPLLLGPFILVYMNTVENPWPPKKRMIVWLSIMAVSILVYLSGLLLYAVI